MLFPEKSLLVISDDAEFLEVVKALPYEIRVVTDNDELLGKSANFITENTILFDLTTANIDIEAILNTPSFEKTLVLVGTQADMELIAGYVERREGMATNYVLKPIIPTLLKNTIENTYSGQELVEFVATIGMELRTPLASIRGYSDLIIRKALDEAGSIEGLNIIKTNAQRLNNLISGFVLTTRLEKGRVRYNLDDFAPIQLVKEAVEKVEKPIPDKKHVVRIEVAENCPRVWVSLNYLEIALEFLLENAYLYTYPEGQIIISAVPDADYVTFSVQDNGVGIKEDDKRQIFSLFFRGDDDLVRQQYGNGMSLYNARLIISAHGGNIWFESEAGKGSTFYFTIPRADQQ